MLCLLPTQYNSNFFNKNNTGLGNVLYQLSTVYCICKKFNLKFNSYYFNKYINKLKNLGFNHHLKIFRKIDLSIQDEKIDLEFKEEYNYEFSNNLINIIKKNTNKNILIKDSYLQSIKYFIEYEKEIQQLFEPDTEFKELINKKYPKIFDNKQSNISIQMRLNWGIGIKLNPEFILIAIDHLKKNNFIQNNINLWIFSDNIPEAKKILSCIKNYNIIFVNDNQYDYEDLWMMSLINNHIVSFSTFSWWGAFLNQFENKKIIYSEDFKSVFCEKILGPKWINNSNNILDDTYPKNWIMLKNKYIIQ